MKEVDKISFKSIYEYITCPLKLAFSDKDKNYTISELYDYAGRESLITLFSFIALNRSWSKSYSEAMTKFNFIWSSNLDRLTEKYTGNISFAQNYLMTRVKSFYDSNKDEIVSVNFPLEYSINSNTIVTDNIDLLLINSQDINSKKHYRAINFINRLPFENSRYYNLRSGFFRLVIQSYLTKSHYRDFSYELRPLTGKDEVFTCNPQFLSVIRTIVKNVSVGIKNKVTYATNNDNACKLCAYKNKCSLSLISKL